MDIDLYKDFANRYDLFYGKFGTYDPLIKKFYQKLFTDNQIHRVLDCACGTGRDLYLFHLLGCETVGSDISDSMLAQARTNLSQCGVEIPLYKVDYRILPENFEQRFDVVVCLSSSILHMPNEKEVLLAFRSMHEVLRENGILVLTSGTSDYQWNKKPRFIPAVNTNDFSRLFVIDYFGKGARYNIIDLFHSEEKTDFKVWSVDYTHVLLRDDHERLLNASGFKKREFYRNYHFDPYDKEKSGLLIAVAYK
jgi:SAM-dependent methyltransferase